MPVEVGAEIAAHCPSCLSDTTHTIAKMYEDEIRRVTCKVCGNSHGYREPTGASEPAVEPPPTPAPATTSASATAAELTERWYGVTLPAEYRAFLDDKLYERYASHRLASLPSYGRKPPRLAFVHGDSVFGLANGARRLDPERSAGEALVYRTGLEAGTYRGPGDFVRQQVFAGLPRGTADTRLPFALLGDTGQEAQALAIDIAVPGCPILMFEHERAAFVPVADSLAAFLASLQA
jgi:hypothetical protein